MEDPSAQRVAQLRLSISSSAPHAKISNKVDKAVDLTSTVAAIVKEVAEVLRYAPYVKTLSGVILQFIKIKEELKLNKERCHEIIDKVLHLSHWIYAKLTAIAKSGERVKENLAEIEHSLNLCASTLKTVLDELKKHQSRNKFTKLISRGLEDLNKLDRSVDNLEKRLVRDIVFDIKLQQGIITSGDVANTASNPSSGGYDHVLPPKPHILIERDSQLEASLKILLAADASRITILGGGGFGKTTLARSILYDPKIMERFKSRYFLSCEGMTNADTLLLGLGAMLRLTAPPSDVLASARRVLQSSATLLCLDNFETPWEPSATRTNIEDLLALIVDIPNLSLIITMRGTQRPSKVPWSRPLLDPLSTLSSEGARLILQEICPEHTVDEFTEKLLDAIEGIPLAVTLISNLLRDGESSRALWVQWSKEHTTIIENGGDDRESNLDASIALSVNSPRMKRDPGAMALLAALSLLPDGFPLAEIEKLAEYLGINSIHKPLQTLRGVALIKPDEAAPSPRIRMLSPIRLFCDHHLSSEISVVLEKVVSYYISLMFDAEGEQDNSEIYAQIVPEIPNIHLVFQRGYNANLNPVQDITRFTDATVALSYWSDYIGYLTQDTIRMALERSTNLPVSHAECLEALGELYFSEGNYQKAKTSFAEAADLFKQGNSPVDQAHVLDRLADMLQLLEQYDQAGDALKTSLKLYTEADDKWGQTDVGLGLGELYIEKGQYLEAEESLMASLEAYKEMEDLIGQSNTAETLSRLHSRLGNMSKAEEFAIDALETAKRTNFAGGEGNAVYQLGCIYFETEKMAEARQTLEKALLIYRQSHDVVGQLNAVDDLGQVYIQLDQLSAAEVLLTEFATMELDVIQIPKILATLGWLYICGDRLDKAEQYLDRALKLFQKSSDIFWQAGVLSHLGAIYLRSNKLEDAERVLKSIPDLDEWEDIEMRQLWVLGDLYTVKEQFDEAEDAFNSAMALCQSHEEPYSYQQGNILRSMGTLHMKRGRVDRAVRTFKRAHNFHCEAQWVSEQATDLKRLGEAYKMLGRSEEAEAVFKEAEALVESVSESRVLSKL